MRNVARNRSTSGRRRLARLLSVAGLLIAAVGVSTAVDSTPAVAACAGSENPYWITYYTNGTLAAEEKVQYASTCDGDSQFRDKVLDAKTDGHCAYVDMWDPSRAVIGEECTTGSWSSFTGWDQQGNSDAKIDVCLYYDCRNEAAAGGPFATWGF